MDTATPAVTAALVTVAGDDVALVATRVTVDARAHAEALAPQIDAVLDEAGVGVDALGAVVAGVGPGPYTGLRVGLVTAASLGHALGVPTYGVCSLDGIGAATSVPGRLVAATDARRREIYWRVYESGAPVTDPAVGQPTAVAEQLAALGVSHAAGHGATRYAGALALPTVDPEYPDPLVLARLAADRIRTGAPTEPLTPLYLRHPDATAPGTRKPVLR